MRINCRFITANAFLTTLAFWWIFVAPIRADDALWTTDYDDALKRAKTENKLVFLDFTGSDWRAGCIFLRENVLSSETFVEYAKEHLILVELDFPLKKPSIQISNAETKIYNENSGSCSSRPT